MTIPGLVRVGAATILTLEEERRESHCWDPGERERAVQRRKVPWEQQCLLVKGSDLFMATVSRGEQGNKYQDFMLLHPFDLFPVSLRIQLETREQGRLLMHSSQVLPSGYRAKWRRQHSFQIKFTVHLHNGQRHSGRLDGSVRVTRKDSYFNPCSS